MCNSLRPHGLQHTRLPCPSPSPGIGSNSCQLSWWWCPTISSSLVPFSCLQSSQLQGLFQWVCCIHQMTKASASASVFPMNILGWFPLGLTALISLLSEGLWRVFSSTTVWKHQFFSIQPSLWSNSHILTWLLEKPELWLHGPLSVKWYLCFLICCLILSWLFFQGASVF